MAKRSKKVDETKIRKIQKAVKQHKTRTPEEVVPPASNSPPGDHQDIDFVQAGIEAVEGEEDKENEIARPKSLMDPHPSAKRMQWEEDQPMEDDVDGEGAFAEPQPARNIRGARLIRYEPKPAPVVRNTVTRTKAASSKKLSSSQRVASLAPTPAQRPASHEVASAVSSSPDEAEAPTGTLERRAMVRDVAVAKARMVVRKEQGPRSQYTEEEEACLEELIGELGPSYSAIKNHDNEGDKILAGRTQVNLKDKAQEMVFQYLSNGFPLPPNFHKIKLRQRMKDKLLQRGIDVDALHQDEQDVGE